MKSKEKIDPQIVKLTTSSRERTVTTRSGFLLCAPTPKILWVNPRHGYLFPKNSQLLHCSAKGGRVPCFKFLCKFSGKKWAWKKILSFILIFFPWKSLQKNWIGTRSAVGRESQNRIGGPELGLRDPKTEKTGKTTPINLLGVIHDHCEGFIRPGKAALWRQLYIGFLIGISSNIFCAWDS